MMDHQNKKVVMSVFDKLSGGNLKRPTVRLTKIGEGIIPKYHEGHPRHIKINSVAQGKMMRPVAVGESFYVNKLGEKGHFHTSVVQEILSPNTFRTQNSVYRWEIVPE
jgi:hypothetical protein